VILLLFDIDGTLTDTSHDDGRFFCEALAEAGGVTEFPSDLEHFPEVTAPAIARDLIARAQGRRAREGEVYRTREAMSKRWEQALRTGAVGVRSIPGAAEILTQARARDGYFVAIATGAWGPPALLKLQAARLPVDGLVLTSADDSETRRGILETAAILAASDRGIPGFAHIVLIGDGLWDARAARAVGAGFVGVQADGAKAARLMSEGAAGVVPDYADAARFWAAVDATRNRGRAVATN
jgi:phosphoglycolate phosphatase-like HAD superfamily hydrolase